MQFSLVALAGLVPSVLAAAVSSPIYTRDVASASAFEAAASNFNFTYKFAPALEYTFNVIDSIPNDILEKGDDEVNKWLVENDYRSTSAELTEDVDASVTLSTRTDIGELDARGFWDVTKCVGSILWAIGSTAIPIAKIARIKKYIEALGGVKNAVKLMLGATSKAEKLKAGGQALVNLASELLGIASVKANCF